MNRLFAAALVACLAAGCSDRLGVTSSNNGTELKLDVKIAGNSSLETRGPISGTTFPIESTIGIFIICHDSLHTTPVNFTPHQIGTNNMRATATASGWNFKNSVTDSIAPSLFITTRRDSLKADIYAYAPYYNGLSRPDSIPYTFSNNCDLMWARQNDSATVNKKIKPAGSTITVPLTFEHVLSRIRFGFKTEHSGGGSHHLDNVHILKSGSRNTPIYNSGKFNALNGTFYDMVQSQDSICMSFNYAYFSDSTKFTYFDVLLYPTTFQTDDDLTVIFTIDGFRYTYVMKKDDVEHRDTPTSTSGNGTYGFQKGFIYKFNFLFDNYVHLRDIEIQQEWTPGNLFANI